MKTMARIGTHAWVLAIMALSVGCGPTGGSPDGGTPGDAPIGTDAPGATCPHTPVTGTFVRLSGSGEATASFGTPPRVLGTIAETIDVYLPDGVDDGDRLVVAHPVSWPHGGVVVSVTTLSEGRGTFALNGSYGLQDFSVGGTFDATLGIASVRASRNFARPDTDVADYGEADLVLCPTGSAAPAPSVAISAPTLLPTSSFHLVPSTPMAIEGDVSIGEQLVVHVRAGASDVPVDVTRDVGGAFVVSPVMAFPPNTPLEITVDAVDVLDRPVTTLGDGALAVLSTTAVATDPSLDTEPPSGAMVGDAFSWVDGRVEAGGVFGSAGRLSLALDPGGATVAHVTLPGCPSSLRMALVGAAGEHAVADADCDPADPTLDFAVPASGVVHLVVDATRATPSRPQWLPSPPVGSFAIEGITFE